MKNFTSDFFSRAIIISSFLRRTYFRVTKCFTLKHILLPSSNHKFRLQSFINFLMFVCLFCFIFCFFAFCWYDFWFCVFGLFCVFLLYFFYCCCCCWLCSSGLSFVSLLFSFRIASFFVNFFFLFITLFFSFLSLLLFCHFLLYYIFKLNDINLLGKNQKSFKKR